MADAMIHLGDCLGWLATLPEESVDAVVTDPPYGLSFMGQVWDTFDAAKVESQAFQGANRDEHASMNAGTYDLSPKAMRAFHAYMTHWAAACLRVLKPGGHLVAFGSSRTAHRLACAVEDAGFEIRDTVYWCYANGFPKNHDVSKALDKARQDREQVLQVTRWIAEARDAAGLTNRDLDRVFGTNGMAGHWTSSASQPAVPTLEQIPALVGLLGNPPDEIRELLMDLNRRKGSWGNPRPDRVTVERGGNHVLQSTFGTVAAGSPVTAYAKAWHGWGTALKPAVEPAVLARKPFAGTVAANVLEHGTAALHLDACRHAHGAPEWLFRGKEDTRRPGNPFRGHVYGEGSHEGICGGHPGGRWPANLIYVPKPSRAERERGTDGLPARSGHDAVHREQGSAGLTPSAGAGRTAGAIRNFHPTVKPVRLMRWLVRLITPPGGLVIDPFTGSGTTAVAATLEGFRFAGAEMDPDFHRIAEARAAHAAAYPESWADTAPGLTEKPKDADWRERTAKAGQMELIG